MSEKSVKEFCDVFGKFNRKTIKAVTEIDFHKEIYLRNKKNIRK